MLQQCLIYLLTCKVCGKQYTGKTVDKFRSRWNNFKDSSRTFLRGEEIKQKFLHEHLLKDDHHCFEKVVSICVIAMADPGLIWACCKILQKKSIIEMM